MAEETFEGWAVLELMGHRRLVGYVREVELAGAGFLSIDVAGEDGGVVATQLYSASAVYCITPTNEETVREAAGSWSPPVHRWALPARAAIEAGPGDDDAGEGDDDSF
jgi:hypothetical protein